MQIPLSIPHLAGNELKYVEECIRTNFVSSVGPFVDRFERMVADFVGARYGVAAVNGTAALHVALLVAGIRPDDEVLVSDLTFVAPANAIRYANAWPVLIDSEPRYFEMDANRVVDFLDNACRWTNGELRNKTTGRRVSAIVPVHVLGHPVDIDPILEAARKYELRVIEDATESIGSRYRGRPTGTLGDLGCFSFNGNKIITTGGGGAVVTNDEALARHTKYLTTQAKDDPVEYIHNEIGYNYRLTNLLAALGVAQMEQLPSFIERKRRIAQIYGSILGGVPGITLMEEAPWASTNWWLYTIRIDEEQFGMDSRAVMRALAERGMQSRPLWRPMHMLVPFAGVPSSLGGVSERLYRESLSIPCSVGSTDEDITNVANALVHLRRSVTV